MSDPDPSPRIDPREQLGAPAGIMIFTPPDRFERMRDFYRDVLGLTPRSLKPAFMSVEWGELRLNIVAHSQLQGPSADPLRLMVTFFVQDIHAVHRRLAAAGVAFIRPPEQEDFGGWFATFHDPDGNTLQLFAPAP